MKENANLADLINVDLSFAVALNHALCLEANSMIQEALTKYNEIIKSKQFQFAGRIRVNIANIYYNQKNIQLLSSITKWLWIFCHQLLKK